jgi:NlpC/P60 family
VFLDSALAQRGDRYIFGVMDDLNDPDPKAFDCSMLVQWSAHQAGTDLERNAWHQYQQLHAQGMTISVQDAIHTPGALLFSFNSDPNGSNAPVHQHVAISLGNGKTIEALGAQYGVNEFDATTKRFQYAALIPGISDHVGPVGALPDAAPAAVPTPPPVTPHPTVTPAADTSPPPDHHDPFLAKLAVDPDALDSGHPGAAVTAPPVVAPDPHPHVDPVSVDVDGDGLDDSLQDSGDTWSVPHPVDPYHHGTDGWDHHDGHH